jgi:hypothetical protein
MPFKGHRHSEETKRKLSSNWNLAGRIFRANKTSFTKGDQRLIGNKNAEGMKPNQTSFKKGEHRSLKIEFKKGEMSEKMKNNKNSHTGEKHHKWKGGFSFGYIRKHLPRPIPEQCEICGVFGKDMKKGLCYDHNHETNKFRGWICGRCNIALGMVKDNTETLLAMVKYLKKNET